MKRRAFIQGAAALVMATPVLRTMAHVRDFGMPYGRSPAVDAVMTATEVLARQKEYLEEVARRIRPALGTPDVEWFKLTIPA